MLRPEKDVRISIPEASSSHLASPYAQNHIVSDNLRKEAVIYMRVSVSLPITLHKCKFMVRKRPVQHYASQYHT